MPPAGWSALKPQKIKTWVRIRPLASEGGGGGKPVDGHTDGKPVEKQLGAFDEKSVKIIHHDQRSKEQAYDYPSRVFPVDCSQEDVGKDVLPGLLDDFWNDRSGVIFAYGQTGSGKTMTVAHVQRQIAISLFGDRRAGSGGPALAVEATAVEVMGKRCTDLLFGNECKLQQDAGGGLRMCGAGVDRVGSADLLRSSLRRAFASRRTEATRRAQPCAQRKSPATTSLTCAVYT